VRTLDFFTVQHHSCSSKKYSLKREPFLAKRSRCIYFYLYGGRAPLVSCEEPPFCQRAIQDSKIQAAFPYATLSRDVRRATKNKKRSSFRLIEIDSIKSLDRTRKRTRKNAVLSPFEIAPRAVGLLERPNAFRRRTSSKREGAKTARPFDVVQLYTSPRRLQAFFLRFQKFLQKNVPYRTKKQPFK
jgi:hypothetical protein